MSYSDITIKWATLDWEVEQSRSLRRRVFCEEQQLFEADDLDNKDAYAQTLVALANHGGWHDRVIGTVRIHREPGFIWWGSRLAVDQSFRYSSGVGAHLIRLAVGSANAAGCRTFKATVQVQNEALFTRLGWVSQRKLMIRGLEHCEMDAILSRFPACYQPRSGYVIPCYTKRDERSPIVNREIAPSLLLPYSAYSYRPEV